MLQAQEMPHMLPGPLKDLKLRSDSKPYVQFYIRSITKSGTNEESKKQSKTKQKPHRNVKAEVIYSRKVQFRVWPMDYCRSVKWCAWQHKHGNWEELLETSTANGQLHEASYSYQRPVVGSCFNVIIKIQFKNCNSKVHKIWYVFLPWKDTSNLIIITLETIETGWKIKGKFWKYSNTCFLLRKR